MKLPVAVPALPYAEVRARTGRTLLEFLRVIHDSYWGTNELGNDAADLLILTAIVVGHAERKLLSASDIAGYVGMPRSTVLRRIRRLQAKLGLVSVRVANRTVYWARAPLNRARSDRLVNNAIRAARELAKLSILDR